MARRNYRGGMRTDDKFRFYTQVANTLRIVINVSSSNFGVMAASCENWERTFTYTIVNSSGQVVTTQTVTAIYNNWTERSGNIAVISLSAGDTVYIEGNNYSGSYASGFYGVYNSLYKNIQFASTNNIYCYGNVMYLCKTDYSCNNLQLQANCFCCLFKDMTKLISAPDLPTINLTMGCYASMFRGCTSLTRSPKIYASSLTIMGCCSNMFNGCTSLNEIYSFSTRDFQNSIMYGPTTKWVTNVSSSGTFHKFSAVTDTFGTYAIPNNWTVDNIDVW